MQASIPDAVKGPNKGGIIIDDKPAGRPISKDKQEMRRNVEAYEIKYGQPANEVLICRYDPDTGSDAGEEHYAPEIFTGNKKNVNAENDSIKDSGEAGKCS